MLQCFVCVCRQSRGGERTINHLEHDKHIGLIGLVVVSESLKERCTSPEQWQCNRRTTSLIIAEFMGVSSIPLEHLPSKYFVVFIVAKALEEPWIAFAPMMQWKTKTVGIMDASGTPNMRGVDCVCYLVLERHSNNQPCRCDITCLWWPIVVESLDETGRQGQIPWSVGQRLCTSGMLSIQSHHRVFTLFMRRWWNHEYLWISTHKRTERCFRFLDLWCAMGWIPPELQECSTVMIANFIISEAMEKPRMRPDRWHYNKVCLSLVMFSGNHECFWSHCT